MANRKRQRKTAAGRNQKPLTGKATAMQQLADLVRVGYTQWTSGVVKQHQLRQLIAKFDARYGTDADKVERRRRRRHGVGNAVLVLYRHQRSRRVVWWLMCQVDHPTAAHHEQLHDATQRSGRVTVPDTRYLNRPWTPDYMLLQVDGRWTWRMTPTCWQQWVERIQRVVRDPEPDSRHRGMRQIAYSLFHVPGYRGIRQQVSELHRTLRAEWRRARPDNEPLPVPPRMPLYTRRRSYR